MRGEVFGNLYLTDKKGALELSEEDEATAVTLAMAAGIAIEKPAAARSGAGPHPDRGPGSHARDPTTP